MLPESVTDKRKFRSEMRALRLAIPDDVRVQRGAAAATILMGLPEVREAGTVMAFASFGSEIPTGPLLENLASTVRRLLLPYLPHGLAGEIVAAELRPGQAPVDRKHTPPEPPDPVAVGPDEIDVIVVPGLAFDREGRRLGQGGGHYDRFVRGLRCRAVRVGFAYAEQLLQRVPAGPGDERVDVVVTDREVVRCFPRR